MCGLVGIAGNLYAREELTMKRLLHLDSLRGMDSTGLAAVRMGGNEVKIAKRASHHFNLFDTKPFGEALQGTSSLAFIGHNRSATVGKIADVNAHPFQIDHITGTHNGTLEDKDKVILEAIAGEKFNTDSEALFAAIAKEGVKEVIPKLTTGRDHYKGAWSLVWWDSEEKTLNFLRNTHRPLWYCYSEDFKLIFWASEFWMLDAALQKTGTYTLYKQPKKDDPSKTFRFFSTQVDVHYKVDVMKLSKGGKDRPKISAVKLAGKEPEEAGPTFPFGDRRSSGTHGSGCGNGSGNAKTTIHINPPTTTQKSSSSAEPAAIHMIGDVSNPYAGYFNKTGFSHLGQSYNSRHDDPECNWCHERVPYGLAGITVFTRCNVILCAKCSGNEPVSLTSDVAPTTRIYVPKAAFNELRG